MHTRPWVFLRGLIRQHRHWEDFPERFRAAFPGTPVLLLDLPGNGDLCDRDSPWPSAAWSSRCASNWPPSMCRGR